MNALDRPVAARTYTPGPAVGNDGRLDVGAGDDRAGSGPDGGLPPEACDGLDRGGRRDVDAGVEAGVAERRDELIAVGRRTSGPARTRLGRRGRPGDDPPNHRPRGPRGLCRTSLRSRSGHVPTEPIRPRPPRGSAVRGQGVEAVRLGAISRAHAFLHVSERSFSLAPAPWCVAPSGAPPANLGSPANGAGSIQRGAAPTPPRTLRPSAGPQLRQSPQIGRDWADQAGCNRGTKAVTRPGVSSVTPYHRPAGRTPSSSCACPARAPGRVVEQPRTPRGRSGARPKR